MKKQWKFVLAGILLIVLVLLYPRISTLTDVDALRASLAPFGWLAALVFFFIYIIAGIMFLPLSVFSIAAGILFGLLWGLIIVLIAATIAAALSFLIARQFSSMIPRFKKGVIQKLQHTVELYLGKNTFQAIFILRLLYLPYIGLSFAAGLVRTCKFWPFVLATFLTNIVGSFVFVYFGDQFGRGLRALIIPVILIGLSLLIPYIVKRFTKKRRVK